MKQSKLASLLDTIGGTAVAFIVALGVQWAVALWFNLPLRMSDNAAIVVIFTVVSLVRGYVWRRFMETVHVRRPLSAMLQAIVAERFRQVDAKGYTPEHDDEYAPGILARAGAAYALNDPQLYPWSGGMRERDFRDRLAIAGALIAAEGERFDRQRKRGLA